MDPAAVGATMDPAAIEGALNELRAQVARLTVENENFRSSQQGVQEMARSLGELAKSLSKKDGGGRRLLLDTKGLG